MAFGIKREELIAWKRQVDIGEIAILTHYWEDPRFPNCTTVTKIGCSNLDKLIQWGAGYGLKEDWIHYSNYPHFDVFGFRQKEILQGEGRYDHILRFHI